MVKFIFNIFILFGVSANAQIDIPIELVKDTTTEIADDFKIILTNPSGWQSYANYEFSNDTIKYIKNKYIWNFRTNRFMNVKWKQGYDSLRLKGRYKINNGNIVLKSLEYSMKKRFFNNPYFMKILKSPFYKKRKRMKIIKLNKAFIILEEKTDSTKIRIVLIANS